MKWLKYFNIGLIISWLSIGIRELWFAPSVSKFSYGCLLVVVIWGLICDTIKLFIEEKHNG